jgi:hypothetical protein
VTDVAQSIGEKLWQVAGGGKPPRRFAEKNVKTLCGNLSAALTAAHGVEFGADVDANATEVRQD